MGLRRETKPAKSIPGEPDNGFLGNYLFNTDTVIEALTQDAKLESSNHDFGRDILPSLTSEKAVYAHDFRKNRVPSTQKARSPVTGAISEPSKLTTRLTSISVRWILRSIYITAVGRFVPRLAIHRPSSSLTGSIARAWPWTRLSLKEPLLAAAWSRTVVGRNVRIHSYSQIEGSVIMDWAEIGGGCKIRRAIIDKSNVIPPEPKWIQYQ